MNKKILQKITYLLLVSGTSCSVALAQNKLQGRAVLPANTFSNGPTSGRFAGANTNGVTFPFINQQPVQGFSGLLPNADSTFTGLADNGYGSLETSADFNLRLNVIKPNFKTAAGGSGSIQFIKFIELNDKDKKIPFTIANEFTTHRNLTGADFDPESIMRAPDSTYWIGEEFGPYLLHFDKTGKLLEAPYSLPDFDNAGKDIRSPQNHFNEESAAIRIMNAVRSHAEMNGNMKAPVFSPDFVLIDDLDTSAVAGNRKTPPAGFAKASTDIFNIGSIKNAGFPVVAWTVNDSATMVKLMSLGVNGIISDNPALLFKVATAFDGTDADVLPDFVDANGLLDINKFDAQGHRGGRNLRPENTLPAWESALDNLMTTLEMDCGITSDGKVVMSHEPYLRAAIARRVNGNAFAETDEILFKTLTLAEIQSNFIADKLQTGRPLQTNDTTLSPVACAFAKQNGMIHPYVYPSLDQMFDFVDFYIAFYSTTGAGKNHIMAAKRTMNAARVRFNVETKLNPRTDADNKGNIFIDRTVAADLFATKVAEVIVAKNMTARADIQSFAFQTLLKVQTSFPQIRTVYLFTDGPRYGTTNEGTNLQPQGSDKSPWLAGMFWPYRVTKYSYPLRAARSGGFEGMALTVDKTKLLPLLELPLAGGKAKTLLIHEFDLATKTYTPSKRFEYPLDTKGTNIGDFIMYNQTNGLIIERDGSQGDPNGFKKVFRVTLLADGNMVKTELVDLMNIEDASLISNLGALTGDIGVGLKFGMPFNTIESIIAVDSLTIMVMDDNNYPFSVGRHFGAKLPDDNELVIIKLDPAVNLNKIITGLEDDNSLIKMVSGIKNYPNPFTGSTSLSISLEKSASVTIVIFNILGEVVETTDLGLMNEGFHNINMKNLESFKNGVYTIKMKAGNKEYVTRAIKTN